MDISRNRKPMSTAKRSVAMYGSLGITFKDVQRLTRWGRVAFAARCARRAQQVLERMGTGANDPSLVACDEALKLAEDSAARAVPEERLDQAMRGVGQLAVAAVTPPHGLPAWASEQSGTSKALVTYHAPPPPLPPAP